MFIFPYLFFFVWKHVFVPVFVHFILYCMFLLTFILKMYFYVLILHHFHITCFFFTWFMVYILESKSLNFYVENLIMPIMNVSIHKFSLEGQSMKRWFLRKIYDALECFLSIIFERSTKVSYFKTYNWKSFSKLIIITSKQIMVINIRKISHFLKNRTLGVLIKIS